MLVDADRIVLFWLVSKVEPADFVKMKMSWVSTSDCTRMLEIIERQYSLKAAHVSED